MIIPGMLFGIAFPVHRIGAFCSSWLGGVCVAATGSYVLIWCVSMVLSLLAAVFSFMVREPGEDRA